MLIHKRSQLTGVVRELEIPVTPEQLQSWKDGMLIQNAMPHLTIEQREFIMTGITQEEWDAVFKDDGDEDVSDETFNNP